MPLMSKEPEQVGVFSIKGMEGNKNMCTDLAERTVIVLMVSSKLISLSTCSYFITNEINGIFY